MPRARSAFTLIELLIVIAIIGLIATIALVGLSGARAKSRDQKRLTDLKQIQKGLELSFEPGAGYPVVPGPIILGAATDDVLCGKGAIAQFAADTSAANCDSGKTFMATVPSNPVPGGANYRYVSTDALGAACTTAPCNGYCVQTMLEGAASSLDLNAGTIIADQTALKNGTCP